MKSSNLLELHFKITVHSGYHTIRIWSHLIIIYSLYPYLVNIRFLAAVERWLVVPCCWTLHVGRGIASLTSLRFAICICNVFVAHCLFHQNHLESSQQLVGGFSPTMNETYATVQIGSFPQGFGGEHKKHLSCHHLNSSYAISPSLGPTLNLSARTVHLGLVSVNNARLFK